MSHLSPHPVPHRRLVDVQERTDERAFPYVPSLRRRIKFLDDLLGLGVSIGRSLPHGGENQTAKYSESDRYSEHRIPAEGLGYHTESQAGDSRTGIAEYSENAIG